MSIKGTSAIKASPGLQARMLLVIFLLGAVYTGLIVALIAANVGGIIIGVIAASFFLIQYFGSEALALRAMGVKIVKPEQAPQLHAMIERLCIQADIPKPRIGIVDNTMPNAFAMGRSRKHATVVATTGIINLLSPSELEGVMAHELSHIRHRDVMIMTVASFFASIASMVIQFGFFFAGDDDDNPSGLVLFLVAIGVYIVSFFLMQALSRYREFAADRGAALLTGRPSALSAALLKISGVMEQIPQRDLRAAHSELNAFYIIPVGAKNSLLNLFSTHPPTERRIAALQQIETQLQGS